MPDNAQDEPDAPDTPGTTTTDGETDASGAADTPRERLPPPERERRRLPLWAETVLLLVIALAMALIIKTFFVQAFYIPSESMEPGLVNNDRILVEKPSYWFGGEPQRGDVIVFKDPAHWLTAAESAEPTSIVAKGLEHIGLYPSGGHLVKRVIGLPGDTIHCCNTQGQLEINGVAVDESDFAVRRGAACDGPMVNDCRKIGWTVEHVPPGDLFVMGDNRSHSGDSSAHLTCSRGMCTGADAFVPEDDVVGKVFSLVWPIKRFTFIGRPDAFKDVPAPTS